MNENEMKAFITSMAVGAAMIDQKGASQDWTCDEELTSIAVHALNEDMTAEQAYQFAKNCAVEEKVPAAEASAWDANHVDYGCALGSILGFPDQVAKAKALEILGEYQKPENVDIPYIQEFYNWTWKPEHEG